MRHDAEAEQGESNDAGSNLPKICHLVVDRGEEERLMAKHSQNLTPWRAWGRRLEEPIPIEGAEVRWASDLIGVGDVERPVVCGARVLVLGSGSGSNFEALVVALRPYGVNCVGLFCDRPGALILSRAVRLGIPCYEPPPPEQRDKRALNDAVTAFLEQHPFDLALLAGYMRVLPSRVIRPFFGKIVNIHPSILPDYAGLDAIQRAYVAQDAWVGVSIHLVDEGVDEGPLLSQGRIPRQEGESLASLEARIHRLEHALYPWTVLALLAQRRAAQATHTMSEGSDVS